MPLGGQLVGPILEILEIFGPVISVMDILLVLRASYKCHGHMAGPSCQLCVCVYMYVCHFLSKRLSLSLKEIKWRIRGNRSPAAAYM